MSIWLLPAYTGETMRNTGVSREKHLGMNSENQDRCFLLNYIP